MKNVHSRHCSDVIRVDRAGSVFAAKTFEMRHRDLRRSAHSGVESRALLYASPRTIYLYAPLGDSSIVRLELRTAYEVRRRRADFRSHAVRTTTIQY